MGKRGSVKTEVVLLGDTVNTAARLQEFCPQAGNRALASAALLKLLELPFGITKRPLGDLHLRGKESDVVLYALEKERAITQRLPRDSRPDAIFARQRPDAIAMWSFAQLHFGGDMYIDPALLSPVSALMGALIGGSTSLVAAVYTQRHQDRLQRVASEVAKRETVYADFVMSASNLVLNAYTHDEIVLSDDERRLIGLMNRMRLFAPPDVIRGAEAVLRAIVEISLKPSVELRQLAKLALSKSLDPDPLLAFSLACRYDLDNVRRTACNTDLRRALEIRTSLSISNTRWARAGARDPSHRIKGAPLSGSYPNLEVARCVSNVA